MSTLTLNEPPTYPELTWVDISLSTYPPPLVNVVFGRPFRWLLSGQFDRAKPTLRILLAFWTFDTVLKRFRSFNIENLGFVGQRAAKLPAIKLWKWFNPAQSWIRADWFEWGRGWAADFFLRPPTLTASNFEALWSIDLKFLALKDLNPLQKYNKNQEASYNFWLGFALSNRPHFAS